MEFDSWPLVAVPDVINNREVGSKLRCKLTPNVQMHRVEVVFSRCLVVRSNVRDEVRILSCVVIESEVDEQLFTGESGRRAI